MVQALKDMVSARALGWRKGFRMSERNNERLNTLGVSGYPVVG